MSRICNNEPPVAIGRSPTYYSHGYYATNPRPLDHPFLKGIAWGILVPAANHLVVSSKIESLEICSKTTTPFTVVGSLDPTKYNRDTVTRFDDSACRIVQGRSIFTDAIPGKAIFNAFTYQLSNTNGKATQ
jgi:hypothetical protein